MSSLLDAILSALWPLVLGGLFSVGVVLWDVWLEGRE